LCLDENVLDENVFRGLFAILYIFFGFIRVIRGLTLYLGLFEFIRGICGLMHYSGLRMDVPIVLARDEPMADGCRPQEKRRGAVTRP